MAYLCMASPSAPMHPSKGNNKNLTKKVKKKKLKNYSSVSCQRAQNLIKNNREPFAKTKTYLQSSNYKISC